VLLIKTTGVVREAIKGFDQTVTVEDWFGMLDKIALPDDSVQKQRVLSDLTAFAPPSHLSVKSIVTQLDIMASKCAKLRVAVPDDLFSLALLRAIRSRPNLQVAALASFIETTHNMAVFKDVRAAALRITEPVGTPPLPIQPDLDPIGFGGKRAPKFSKGQSDQGKGYQRDQRKGYQRDQRQGDDKAGKCFCCGRPGHFKSACAHKDKSCNNCGKKGHLSKMCRSKKPDQQGQRSAGFVGEAPPISVPDVDDQFGLFGCMSDKCRNCGGTGVCGASCGGETPELETDSDDEVAGCIPDLVRDDRDECKPGTPVMCVEVPLMIGVCNELEVPVVVDSGTAVTVIPYGLKTFCGTPSRVEKPLTYVMPNGKCVSFGLRAPLTLGVTDVQGNLREFVVQGMVCEELSGANVPVLLSTKDVHKVVLQGGTGLCDLIPDLTVKVGVVNGVAGFKARLIPPPDVPRGLPSLEGKPPRKDPPSFSEQPSESSAAIVTNMHSSPTNLINLPKDASKSDLRLLHCALGHAGFHRMCLTLKGLCGMDLNLLKLVVSECVACKVAKPPSGKPPLWLTPNDPSRDHFNFLVHVDLLTVSERYGVMVLTQVEDSCGVVRIEPVGSKHAEVVKDAFVKSWVCRIGACSVVRSDRGTEFNSLEQWCELNTIKYERTASYSPEGKVERMNGIILEVLRCVIVANPHLVVNKPTLNVLIKYVVPKVYNNTVSVTDPDKVSPNMKAGIIDPLLGGVI